MVIVPEIRDGKPVWMTGRVVSDEKEPKFQAMPGGKPILGIGTTTPDEALVVTEGVFDYVTLKRWGFNAVALCGNGNIEKAIAELKRATPTALVFAFDSDEKTLLMMQQISHGIRMARQHDPTAGRGRRRCRSRHACGRTRAF